MPYAKPFLVELLLEGDQFHRIPLGVDIAPAVLGDGVAGIGKSFCQIVERDASVLFAHVRDLAILTEADLAGGSVQVDVGNHLSGENNYLYCGKVFQSFFDLDSTTSAPAAMTPPSPPGCPSTPWQETIRDSPHTPPAQEIQ